MPAFSRRVAMPRRPDVVGVLAIMMFMGITLLAAWAVPAALKPSLSQLARATFGGGRPIAAHRRRPC